MSAAPKDEQGFDPDKLAADGATTKQDDGEKAAAAGMALAAQQKADRDALVARFNHRFMVVNETGKCFIFAPRRDDELHRTIYDRIKLADFKQLYANEKILVGKKAHSVADVWFGHESRRQFLGGVVFDPSGRGQPSDVLNLWQGFAVTPAAGSWAKLREHIRIVICREDELVFDYLLRWMARLVQFPGQQGEVAVVMRGGEGSGKGTLARALMRIIGQHAMQVANAKHLVGSFNAHLRDCVFLFADEALFAGDKQHVGVLKSLITEPVLTIEGKYLNAVQSPNYLHVMLASNEDWVVPAALDARRFLMLDVMDTRRDDYPYFTAIWDELEAGGYAAMLRDLLALDLAGFNVRAVPKTEALQAQKQHTLATKWQWWQAVLHRGYVFESRHGLEDYFGWWRPQEPTRLLFASYAEHARTHGERHPMNPVTFGRFMMELGGRWRRLTNPVVGEHVVRDGSSLHGYAELLSQPQATGYHFGDLTSTRAAFCKATGLQVEWPEVSIYENARESSRARYEEMTQRYFERRQRDQSH